MHREAVLLKATRPVLTVSDNSKTIRPPIRALLFHVYRTNYRQTLSDTLYDISDSTHAVQPQQHMLRTIIGSENKHTRSAPRLALVNLFTCVRAAHVVTSG